MNSLRAAFFLMVLLGFFANANAFKLDPNLKALIVIDLNNGWEIEGRGIELQARRRTDFKIIRCRSQKGARIEYLAILKCVHDARESWAPLDRGVGLVVSGHHSPNGWFGEKRDGGLSDEDLSEILRVTGLSQRVTRAALLGCYTVQTQSCHGANALKKTLPNALIIGAPETGPTSSDPRSRAALELAMGINANRIRSLNDAQSALSQHLSRASICLPSLGYADHSRAIASNDLAGQCDDKSTQESLHHAIDEFRRYIEIEDQSYGTSPKTRSIYDALQAFAFCGHQGIGDPDKVDKLKKMLEANGLQEHRLLIRALYLYKYQPIANGFRVVNAAEINRVNEILSRYNLKQIAFIKDSIEEYPRHHLNQAIKSALGPKSPLSAEELETVRPFLEKMKRVLITFTPQEGEIHNAWL